jgi:hypothetical protein
MSVLTGIKPTQSVNAHVNVNGTYLCTYGVHVRVEHHPEDTATYVECT